MILKANYWKKAFKFKLLALSALVFTTTVLSTHIRVLLYEVEHNSPKKVWTISSSSNRLELIYPHNNARKKINKEIKVTIDKGNIFFNTSKFNKSIAHLKPIEGTLLINEKPYQGSIYIIKHPTGYLFINKLDIEDYICSVLHTESWPGWPLEVNKALAIACRTYAATKILESSKKKRPFHIRNCNKHQTYSGLHHKDILRQAVEETRGVVIGYNNKPILAMFDGCCGGIIPSHIEGYDFSKTPYLSRNYACEFCKDYKIFSWKAEFSKSYLEKVLKENLASLKRLKQIVTEHDNAGVVKRLIIKDHKTDHFLEGAVLYSLLKEIVSFSYSIEHLKDTIIIKGKGYGHHLGLCQWGAKKMVDLGWSYKQILEFYYPKTNLLRLKSSKK